MQTDHKHPQGGRRRTILWLLTGLFLALAAICFVYTSEHRSHLAQALISGLVLACPLMHLFGHGSHRHGSSSPKKPT